MGHGVSRREFVRRSAGWTALFVVGCAGRPKTDAEGGGTVPGGDAAAAPPVPLDPSDPIDEAPDFSRVDRSGKLPFAVDFTGDDFRIPHDVIIDPDSVTRGIPGGKLPDPDERVPLVIVGGGIGGLGAAHLLRDLRPVLLEQAPRFGGNAKGEAWRGSTYGIGAAYYIQPDDGDDLDRIYEEIGIKGKARKLEVVDPVEYRGKIYREFWKGEAAPGEEAAFATYAERMHAHAEEAYPDIPITDEEGRAAVVELDRRSLRDVVTEWLGGKVPEALRAALQNYCYSSMGSGWQEVSAAAGINFLAGEEFGVLALPGGNAAMTRALVRSLRSGPAPADLRPGSCVFSVRRSGDGVRVDYVDAARRPRSLEARAAVLACPKYVVKHVLKDMEPDRVKAIETLQYRGYVVVNVLLRHAIQDDFYDLYLLRDGAVVEADRAPGFVGRATDVVQGDWARKPSAPDSSVLTLYWPLPWTASREEVLFRRDAWEYLRPRVEAQILEILPILGVPASAVEQVRMSRWGHAVPLAAVGFIADGHADVLRRPFGERIFFVNQDNWALPAVETALTEAIEFAPKVRAAVG